MIEREDGYYWVKFDGEWVIAEWTDSRWISAHHSRRGGICSHEITEIDDVKLIPTCDDDSRFVWWQECDESITAGNKIGRERGFYWMNAYDSWFVVEWVYGNWKNIDIPSEKSVRIIERRIVRPEPEASV